MITTERLSQADMEQLSQQALNSLDEPTPDTYLSLIKKDEYDDIQIETLRRDWVRPAFIQSIKDFGFDVNAPRTFIAMKQENDKAGHYALTKMGSKRDSPAIYIRSFVREKDGWKMFAEADIIGLEVNPETGKSQKNTSDEDLMNQAKKIVQDDTTFIHTPPKPRKPQTEDQQQEAKQAERFLTDFFTRLSQGEAVTLYDQSTSRLFQERVSKEELTNWSKTKPGLHEFSSLTFFDRSVSKTINLDTGSWTDTGADLRGDIITKDQRHFDVIISVRRSENKPNSWQVDKLEVADNALKK